MKAFSTYFSHSRLSHWCCLVIFALFAVNTAVASHDDCSGAVALVCGDIVSGNNEGANTEALPACGMVFPGQTHWYTIVGTGGDITASTCSSNTDFDTQIGVFTGTCGALSCVAGNNNDLTCDNPRFSTVTFPSTAGVTYFIVVAGVLAADGDYELSIVCGPFGPANDECEDAESIACGDSVEGTTVGASDGSGLGFCGTSLDGSPGVWYEFDGDGSTVTASTCNRADFDTKIGVFSGSCGDLVCEDGNDDGDGCAGFTSEITFTSVPGTTYYIFVTGFLGDFGDFELSITCETPATNDDACDADALALGVTTPFDLTGTSAQAGEPSPGAGTGASSCDSQDGWCSFETDVDASVWYTFVAPENGCVDIELTGGDSQLAVWSVDDCGDFGSYVEVAANDDGGDGLAGALFNLSLEPGETYYVQVDDFGGGPTFASGDITVSESDGCVVPPPPAAACGDAPQVFCGDKISGDTRLGSVNTLSCGPGASNNLGLAKGLWYAFEGNNTEITLSTCFPILDFDIKLGVFAGPCEALTCVGVSSNLGAAACTFLSGRADEMSFLAFQGTTYYIYVTGINGAAGFFEMSLECGAPVNDECVGALPVACGETVSGSTATASDNSGDFIACDESYDDGPGVWYQIVAPADGTLTASTCNQADFDTKLHVFEGACGVLSCVAGNDDGPGCGGFTSEVTWPTLEGLTYYVYVSGFLGDSGDFDLTIDGDCGDEPPVCFEAEEVFCGDVVSGSTVGEPTLDLETCGTTLNTGPGVWYSFVGTGDVVTASTCNSASYDTKIGIFTGCNIDDFECVAGNDDGTGCAGFTSEVEFLGEDGVTYYIYVTGFLTASGTFDLSITCSTPPPPIPACLDAAEIFCGDVITDSTVGEPTLDLETCGTSLSSSGGVWFKFTGLGDNVTVSTCGAGTDYDTKIGVFTGDCSIFGLACIGGNDDDCGLQSSVTFAAMNGVEYLIYVTGFGTNSGTFELSVECDGMAPLVVDENGLSEMNTTQIYTTEHSDNVAVGDFYPNPSAHNTNVQIYAPVEAEAQIQLFDAIGRLAHRTEVDLYSGVNTVELQIANLPVGSYYARILIGKEAFQKKLVIVKQGSNT